MFKSPSFHWTLYLIFQILASSVQANQVALSEAENRYLKENPEIVIGSGVSFEPYVIQNNDGSISGYDVEIARRVEKFTGLKIAFKLDEWEKIQRQARERKVDGLSGAVNSKKREKFFNATKAYKQATSLVFVRKGNPLNIKNLSDLDGKKVTLLKGGNTAFYKSLTGVYKDLKITYLNTFYDLISALASGKSDFIILDDTTPYLANTLGLGEQIEPVFTIGAPFPIHFLLRNDHPELVSLFNKGLEQITVLEFSKWSFVRRSHNRFW